MAKKNTATSINQTAIGTDNIQIAGSNNVVNRITNIFTGDQAQRDLRNRRAMLELVKNTWIKGVLDRSLHNEVLLQLDLEERPGAVEHPWDTQVRMPDRPNRTLTPGISLVEVFDEMNGAMLILGEPGSGKTTMLLELARDCIDLAEQDYERPIPVVFNLSSWDGRQTIGEWLVNELQTKYSVGKKIAEGWVENDDLQVLLDGLDEVKHESRDGCVKAINDFRLSHGLSTSIAVCSRITDYEALTARLSLTGAVLLQPLTSEQIEWYFEQAGSELEGVRNVLKNDEVLQEMVKQPLLLSILTLAYQNKPIEAFSIDASDTIAKRRGQLFDTYIEGMFERVGRTKSDLYNSQQTSRWLAWLAKKMIEHNQAPFLIERMQPSWLDQKKQVKRYHMRVGVSLGLIFVSLGLVFGLSLGSPFGLILGSILGLIYGLLNFSGKEDKWTLNSKELFIRLSDLPYRLQTKIKQAGMVTLSGELSNEINTVDKLAWNSKKGFFGLIKGLMGGGGNLTEGLEINQVEMVTYPGERLVWTTKNFLLSVLIGGLTVVLTVGLQIGPIGMLICGLPLWLIFGLAIGLPFGGKTLIQHYTLRSVLSTNDILPWKLIPLLDYCVDLIFLRQVGGGYIFIHRLLMEHFAAMYTEDTEIE